MKQIKIYLTKVNNDQFEVENINELLDSTRMLKTFSTELNDDYIAFEQNILSEINKLRTLETQQASIGTSHLAKNATSYSGRTVIVEGNVKDIGKDKNGNAFILLTNDIRCLLSSASKKDILNINLGANLLVKGTVSSSSGNITLSSSYIFRKKDLSKNYDVIVARSQQFMITSLGKIDKEIQSHFAENVSKLYSDGITNLDNQRWEKALANFTELKKASSEYKGVDSLLRLTKNNIDYNTAISYNNSKDHLKAYLLFERLLFPSPFLDSEQMYENSVNNYVMNEMLKAEKENSTKTYVAVIDTIQKKIKTVPRYGNRLKQNFRNKIEESIITHYRGDIGNYSIIPEGVFFRKDIGEQIDIETFLISPYRIDRDLIKAYDFIHSTDLFTGLSSDKINLSKTELNKIAKWLNLSLVSDDQNEYIDAQGFRSIREKEIFGYSNNNYKVDADYLTFCLKLEDIKDINQKDILESKANKIKDAIESIVRGDIELAYNSGRVEPKYNIYFFPNIGYKHHWSDWATNTRIHQDDIVVSSSSSNIMGGILLAYTFGEKTRTTESNKVLKDFEFIGVSGSYYKGVGFNVNKIEGINQNQNFYVEKYSNSGFEIELTYSNRYFFSLGYAFFNNKFDTRFEDSIIVDLQTISKSISAASLTAGLRIARDFVLYIKTYVDTKNKSMYSWSNGINLAVGLQLGYPFLLGRKDILIF
ncbi:MAG: hypothetical protein OZ930_08215 [Ignavibacteria bacterium]|nr:hypothetical protein [Ignavibacteria bacterium]